MPLAQLFIPSPDPVSTGINIVVGIVTIVGALFGGLFGGGVSDNIKKAFVGIRGAITNMGNEIIRATYGLAKAIGGVFTAISALWTLIKDHLISAIKKLAQKIKSVLDKVLPKVLDAMKRQRTALLDFYNRFLRPIIKIIERTRAVLRVLALFHVPFAKALDRRLAAIEGKILKPFYRLLYRTNTLGAWFNYLLTADLLLHRAILLGSAKRNAGGMFNLIASAPALGSPAALDTTAAADAPFTVADLRSTLVESFTDVVAKVDDPFGDLGKCWKASIQQASLGEGDPLGDMWACLKHSVRL